MSLIQGKKGKSIRFTDPVPQRTDLLAGTKSRLCEDLPDHRRLAGQGLVGGVQGVSDYLDEGVPG